MRSVSSLIEACTAPFKLLGVIVVCVVLFTPSTPHVDKPEDRPPATVQPHRKEPAKPPVGPKVPKRLS